MITVIVTYECTQRFSFNIWHAFCTLSRRQRSWVGWKLWVPCCCCILRQWVLLTFLLSLPAGCVFQTEPPSRFLKQAWDSVGSFTNSGGCRLIIPWIHLSQIFRKSDRISCVCSNNGKGLVSAILWLVRWFPYLLCCKSNCTSFQSKIHVAIKLSILTNLNIWGRFASCFMLYWIDESLMIISRLWILLYSCSQGLWWSRVWRLCLQTQYNRVIHTTHSWLIWFPIQI